jgi:hypothetical protein
VTETEEQTVSLSYEDAQALWDHWASDRDDVLAHAAFERTLRFAAGLQDEGLYFRPGGWVVGLPATVARVACAAAILAGSFEVAGLHDVEREIIIAAAGLISTMDLRPVKLTREDQRLVDRIRDRHLTGTPISPAQARKALPGRLRQDVSEDQIADALDRLVGAGLADREGAGVYVVRAAGGEAWIRISLRSARA